MKQLKENQKVSLTVNQLRHLIKEAHPAKTTRRSTERRPTVRCESSKIDIYPELTDTQSQCPDINAGFYPQSIDGEERYIVLVDTLGESGSLWGPFPTFEAAEDVLFDMAAAFKREDRLVAFTQSSVTFVDKFNGADTCMYIVPGSLGERLDTF